MQWLSEGFAAKWQEMVGFGAIRMDGRDKGGRKDGIDFLCAFDGRWLRECSTRERFRV